MNQSDCEEASFENTTQQELVVGVDDYEVDYTWGDGARKHFLNIVELHIRGKYYATDGKTLPAMVCFTTRNGKEPEPYDVDLFVPGAPGVGKIELATTLQIHAAVTMGGMHNILELMKLDKRKELLVICGDFIKNSLGCQNAELIRFTLHSKTV